MTEQDGAVTSASTVCSSEECEIEGPHLAHPDCPYGYPHRRGPCGLCERDAVADGLAKTLAICDDELTQARAEIERAKESEEAIGEVLLDREADVRRAEAERDAALAVVEAARRYCSAEKVNSRDSYRMMQDMVEALAAFDKARQGGES